MFAFFLGGFGIHNFYLGRKDKGIVKIVFKIVGLFFYICGLAKLEEIDTYDGSLIATSSIAIIGVIAILIPRIWAFIEFILIVCGKEKDSDGLPVINW